MLNYTNNGYDLISSVFVIILFLISQYHIISYFFEKKKRNIAKLVFFIPLVLTLFFSLLFLDFFTNLAIEILVILMIIYLFFKTNLGYAFILAYSSLFIYVGLRYFFAFLFILFYNYDIGHFSSVTYFLSSFSLLILANIFNKYPILKKGEEYPFKYIFCLSITPILSILIINNMYLISTTFVKANSFFSLFTIVLLFFLNLIIFKVFDFLIEDSNIKKQTALFEQQIKSYSIYIKDYDNANKEAKKSQHDLKNQLLYIRKLVEIKESEKALTTLNSLIKDNSRLISGTICGNIVVDSILKSKVVQAKADNINIKYNLEVPVILPFKETDICVLIGNALDNSIEACRLYDGNRYIEIFIKYLHKNLILRIKNPYSGKLTNSGIDFFVSSKSNKFNHGIGLKSISKIVEKYNGVVDINTNNHEFDIKIILIGN